jgi:hypothetical protein
MRKVTFASYPRGYSVLWAWKIGLRTLKSGKKSGYFFVKQTYRLLCGLSRLSSRCFIGFLKELPTHVDGRAGYAYEGTLQKIQG